MRKLHKDTILFDLVQHLLRQRWSPQQIALALARIYPNRHELRVSHETIYNCIYAQPVGELCKELIACLRHAVRAKTGVARSPICSASTCFRPRCRITSFQATGRATSSRAKAMPAQWAPWSSALARC